MSHDHMSYVGTYRRRVSTQPNTDCTIFFFFFLNGGKYNGENSLIIQLIMSIDNYRSFFVNQGRQGKSGHDETVAFESYLLTWSLTLCISNLVTRELSRQHMTVFRRKLLGIAVVGKGKFSCGCFIKPL